MILSLADNQSKIKWWWYALLLLLVGTGAAFVMTNSASAQSPAPTGVSDDQVNAVARQLYCPVCENIPLDVCPTTACAQWRELIREMLGQGRSVEYIKNYFVVHYGTRVLAEPPHSGINLLIYILPPLIFLAGAFLVYRMLRKVHRPVLSNTPPASDLPEQNKYIDQVEEELRKRI